jgi:DNA-binding transcriptional LysR family regulator
MKISLDALRVLDAIDRRGSFAAAADELHRVPSAITYSVRQLEDGLGLAVFDRRGKRATLTPAGRALLDEGRQLLGAAADLECRVQQVARGWESELRIALDTLVPVEAFLPHVAAFYEEGSGTRLRISVEVLGGTWDALATGRADLAVGATGTPPAGRTYASRVVGRQEMRFVAAPSHAICAEPRPLTDATIQRHRAIVIADSSRVLPVRTIGVISGQDTLVVPTMQAKAAAHVAGLGVGFLPRALAEREAAAGRLAVLAVAAEPPPTDVHLAWRAGQDGLALRWFAERLADPAVGAALLA